MVLVNKSKNFSWHYFLLEIFILDVSNLENNIILLKLLRRNTAK